MESSNTYYFEIDTNIQFNSPFLKTQSIISNGGIVEASPYNWLNNSSGIIDSLEFLDSVGASTKDWVMCYPYGAYNNDTIKLLKRFDAALGITTEVRVANLMSDNSFKLPRLDTNDFPQ